VLGFRNIQTLPGGWAGVETLKAFGRDPVASAPLGRAVAAGSKAVKLRSRGKL